MAGPNDIRAGKAVVEIGTDESPFDAGLARVSAKLQAWGSMIMEVGAGLSAAAAAVTVPLTALAFRAADWGQSLLRASQRTGVAVGALSELKYGAEQTGADFETLETAVRKMGQFMVTAAQGSAEAQTALARLGLTVGALNKMSPEQRFSAMADALARVADPTVRAAVAMQVFGRTGTALLPLLRDGAAGLERWRQRARELGLTEGTEGIQSAAAFKMSLGDLAAVLQQLGQTVAEGVIPVLRQKTERITAVVVQVMRWTSENKALIETVFRVAVAVGSVGAVLVGLGTAMVVAGKAVGLIGPTLSAVASAASLLVSPLGLTLAAVAALGGYLVYASGVGRPALAVLGAAFGRVADDAESAFHGVSDALSGGRWALAAQIAMTGVRMVVQRGIVAVADLWTVAAGPIAGAWGDLLGRVVAMTDPALRLVGLSWGQVGDAIGRVFRVAVDLAVRAFSAVEVAVTNWRDVASLAVSAVELAFVRMWGNVLYFVTDLVPAAFKWLTSQGPTWFSGMLSQMLTALGNFASQVWSLIKLNVPLIADYVWATLAGDKNKQGLIQAAVTAALRATATGAPVGGGTAAPTAGGRQKSPLELQLEKEVAGGTAGLGPKLDEAYRRNKAAVDGILGPLGDLGGLITDALNGAKGSAGAELARLQKQLDDLRAEAAKGAAKRPGGELPGASDNYDLLSLGGKLPGTGTFNAAAASLIGGGGQYAERTAKAT
ncbi:MAG: hypothetical protein JWO31_885, partial [Phycisphaerales bacterium]|nr:hypothetical protein [Phycisphaerales bacterium]